mmetsp:Transcript_19052/g.53336  ORF Transcript_19052/g.53336 Transcript_19052/m.53336 type:complete len:135 (-) Transcript_19052:3-407(-)
MAAERLVTEVYSFVSFVASILAAVAWLVWAYAPDEVLAALGVTYYPDKWWAIALPTYLVATLFFVGYTYVALNMMAGCPLDSADMIRDPSTEVTSVLFGAAGEIPDIKDIDLGVINRVLFSDPGAGGARTPTQA